MKIKQFDRLKNLSDGPVFLIRSALKLIQPVLKHNWPALVFAPKLRNETIFKLKFEKSAQSVYAQM